MATPTSNLPIELQNEQKRRSSSRSIKRKRFDDEIVEYGLPQSRGGGGTEQPRAGRPKGTVTQLYATPATLPPPTASPASAAVTVVTSNLQLQQQQQQQANVIIPSGGSTAKSKLGAASMEPPANISALANAPPANMTGKSPQMANVAPAAAATAAVANTSIHANPRGVQMTLAGSIERRRPVARTPNRRARKSGRPPAQVATKDLGRWKPIDDLALICGVQQTNDLRMVHRGVKFSCKFTMQELQARWISLLYEPAISRTALTAMRNLHPELVESIYRRALFSTEEEEILATIKSVDNPKLEKFQELLDKHALVFLGTRTAKSLQKHWQLMKQYQLLPDQTVKSLRTSDQPMSFSDAEDLIVDSELTEQRDESLETELEIADRKQKKEIRLLENELNRWNVLVDSITGTGIAPEFDGQTLAVLRGRLVRYLMRSKEITFGRDAKDCVVDVDLSLEGPACKISRRQGTIKLRSNGDFFIANEGKRSIFIDGVPLLTGNKSRLANNCVVEICGLRFVFLVNYELINAIRHESAKTTSALN